MYYHKFSYLLRLLDTDVESKNLHTGTPTLMDTDADRVARMTERMLSVTGQSTRNHVTFKETPRRYSDSTEVGGGDKTATKGANETLSKGANETFLSTWGSDFTYTNPAGTTASQVGGLVIILTHLMWLMG